MGCCDNGGLVLMGTCEQRCAWKAQVETGELTHNVSSQIHLLLPSHPTLPVSLLL